MGDGYDMSGNSHVIHSSLHLFNQAELDFPQSDPRLGLLVRIAYSKVHSKQMAETYYESPIIIAPGKGERDIEIDSIPTYIRNKSLDIASECRKLSDELIKHALRLEEQACKDDSELVEMNYDKLSKDEDRDIAILDDSESFKVTRQRDMSKSHEKRFEHEVKKESGSSLADLIRKRVMK